VHLNYQNLKHILNPSYDQRTNTNNVEWVESVVQLKRVESVTETEPVASVIPQYHRTSLGWTGDREST
jgi:hypothetical protein